MSAQYTIATMADFAALTPDQRKRCVVDMLVWAEMVDMVRENLGGIVTTPDVMTWVDDDRPGEISAIRIAAAEAQP